MRRVPLILTILALAGSAALPACRRAEEPRALSAAAPAPAAPTWTEADLADLRSRFGDLEATLTGLRFQVLAPGQGEETPAPGDLVSAHYRGTFTDGKVFDESYGRGQPIVFPVGRGRVIKGWDEALVTMRRGEKRRLVIPYWLAYGEAGRPPTIPPRSTLVFEVELLGWETPATGR